MKREEIKLIAAQIDRNHDAELEGCVTMEQARDVERRRDEAHAELTRAVLSLVNAGYDSGRGAFGLTD